MAQLNRHSTSSVSLVVYEYRELELLEIPSEPWKRLTVFQWPSTLLANQVTALSPSNGSTFTNTFQSFDFWKTSRLWCRQSSMDVS